MRKLIAAVFAVSSLSLVSADETPSTDKQSITLMGMLMEWRYPDAEFSGAQMSDAGVTGVVSIKCKSVLTTPDPAEKVLAFYLKKLHVDKDGTNLDQKGTDRVTTDRSVLVQTVSEGESPLYVISVNGHVAGHPTTTTLVVNRSKGDERTRIAWSAYRHLGP